MAGGRSRFDRAYVKGYGRLGHPNGSAHLGRPLRWRHQQYFRSTESSYGKRGGRDRSKDGTSRDRARQTHVDRKMDAFDYYQQGMPGTHQATRQASDDALFIWACATRLSGHARPAPSGSVRSQDSLPVICSPAAAASMITTKDNL